VDQEGNHQEVEALAHQVAVVEEVDPREVPVEAEVMESWGETLLLISMGIVP